MKRVIGYWPEPKYVDGLAINFCLNQLSRCNTIVQMPRAPFIVAVYMIAREKSITIDDLIELKYCNDINGGPLGARSIVATNVSWPIKPALELLHIELIKFGRSWTVIYTPMQQRSRQRLHIFQSQPGKVVEHEKN